MEFAVQEQVKLYTKLAALVLPHNDHRNLLLPPQVVLRPWSVVLTGGSHGRQPVDSDVPRYYGKCNQPVE